MSILCYHSVEPGWVSPLAISPEDFERHCRWLSAHRHVVSLPDAMGVLDSRCRLPRGVTALTFDDGFAALHEYALPVLLAHKLPATVFVVAATVTGSGFPVDWVDTPPPHPMRTLTREQILEMQAAGIAFGSHSFAHRDLTTLDEATCEEDLRRSRAVLEDLLGREVPFLAYPRGRHDELVRRAAAKVYERSFSLPGRAEPVGPQAVPRAGIYPGNGTRSLRLKSSPWYLPFRMSAAYPLIRRAVRPHPPG